MRAFIRHPSDIPIELLRSQQTASGDARSTLNDGSTPGGGAVLGACASPGGDRASETCVDPDRCVVKEGYGVHAGGLCCRVGEPFAVGEPVAVRINLVRPAFETEGRVAWCRPRGNGWEVAVRFLSEQDAFAARMIEQICHIESYKGEVWRREGRALSAEEAAREWIAQYAEHFPALS